MPPDLDPPAFFVVVAQWLDATSVDDWHKLANPPGRAPISTAGLLIGEDAEHIFIAGGYGHDDGRACNTWRIPVAWLRSLEIEGSVDRESWDEPEPT